MRHFFGNFIIVALFTVGIANTQSADNCVFSLADSRQTTSSDFGPDSHPVIFSIKHSIFNEPLDKLPLYDYK